uniref:Integrase core domain containing protein n=1 Tax=Solanum tuberosum TaxID=4113 RepID=M1DLV9_SOLTU
MPSPKGRNQVGDRKKKPADCRVVSRCSAGSSKGTDLEDVECQGRKAMKVTKARLTEWFGEPDLLRQDMNTRANPRMMEEEIENEGVRPQGLEGDQVPQGNEVLVDPTTMTNENVRSALFMKAQAVTTQA